MALGLRKIRTPFDVTPSQKSKKVRIRIPQPPERSFSIGTKDLLIKKYLRESPAWSVIHKRGIYREMVGEDPLEQRAVPHSVIRGTLPERIVYKYLVDKMKMNEAYYEYVESDFDFQSSQLGGRSELGGLVADFLFPHHMLIINVQGSTHKEYLRGRKDEEQRGILENMGYTVYDLWEADIYDEYKLDTIMRSIFFKGESSGSSYQLSESESYPIEDTQALYDLVVDMFAEVRMLHA